MRKAAIQAPTLSVATYREDPLYPRVTRAVEAILQHGRVVAPIDVLVGMGLLTREQFENWRRGRVPYLERVIDCNLTRLSRLLRILRFHAHDLNLVPPRSGVARLASCLTWLLRTFASRCRRTHDGTGALAFACTGSQGPSTLARAMSLSFDLVLQEPRLIRERCANAAAIRPPGGGRRSGWRETCTTTSSVASRCLPAGRRAGSWSFWLRSNRCGCQPGRRRSQPASDVCGPPASMPSRALMWMGTPSAGCSTCGSTTSSSSTRAPARRSPDRTVPSGSPVRRRPRSSTG